MVSTPSLAPTAILTGPTATGKTAIALELAEKQGGIEIVNADSLLIYREMNIGTAKPSAQELARIPHHLINIRKPDEPFTAGDFVREAEKILHEIQARGHRALIVGGTGFYLKALLYGLWEGPATHPEVRERLEQFTNSELFEKLEKVDPQSAYRIGPNDRYRLVRAMEIIEISGKTPSELQAKQPQTPRSEFSLWVVDRTNEELYDRISQRSRAMLKEGLVEETRKLRKKYPGARPLQSVGYEQVGMFLDGKSPDGRKIRPGNEGLQDEIELATRQLVKRQRTWFRGESSARWFKLDEERVLLEAEFEKIYG